MYIRTGYKRRKIRKAHRNLQEKHTTHQHHRSNNQADLHHYQGRNKDNDDSTRKGGRGRKGKKDQKEEIPRPSKN